MKIGLVNKILIGSMALSSCQKPAQYITHQALTPITRSVDTFVPTNIAPEKTLNFLEGLAGLFTDGFGSLSVKAGNKAKKGGFKARPKRVAKPAKPKPKAKSKPAAKPKPAKQTQTPVTPVQRRITSTLDGGNYWVTGKNISYGYPTQYTVPKGAAQKGVKIAGANGISLYRLKIANPDISFDKPIKAGTVLNIPGRYIVTPGTVKSFDDVVKTTKISKHYIKDILVGIEGRKQKPDLVCKSDKVRSKEYPNGCPTIGFGHTGRVDGKVIVNGKTRITTEKAYEILAQDILDAKVDALVFMGKDLFNRAPESVQTGIIDVVFNKGVEPFTRAGSPTALIKSDLAKRDYPAAAAHTVLKTGNRGLKKRNVYRAIMSTEDFSQKDRNRTLQIARPHYIDALSRFPGKKGQRERALMQKAWTNAQNGKTCNFFQ